jgi:hypothetical protein
MVAASLGWSLDKTGERQIEPIIGEANIEFPYVKIEKGEVCGYNQKAYGLMGARK